MRADRILSLLMLLQARGRLTAAALAEELEVSERTIYRDVEALCQAGVPIYTDSGHHGGISLLEDYRTSLTGLSADEARAALLMSIPAPLADLGMEKATLSVLRKLSASLPPASQQAAAHLRQRVHIDTTPWEASPRLPDRLPVLQALQQAALEDEIVKIVYSLPLAGTQFERRVGVYGLVSKAGEWYAVCAWEAWIRPLAVASISAVYPVDLPFQRAPQFELADFWRDWCRKASAGFTPSYRVQVRIKKEAMYILAQMCPSALTKQSESDPLQDSAGWLRLTLVFATIEEARFRLQGFGAALEVLAPLPLRLSIADFARQSVALYDLKP